MRNFYILRGCSGSGKTSLINQLYLHEVTLGYDQFRKLFGTVVECNDGTTIRIEQRHERAAIQATQAALEARFCAGATVVFDSTGLKARYQDQLAVLAARYGYRTWIVDVQGDLTLDEVLTRNRRRESDRVSPEVVEAQWRAARENPIADLPVIADQGKGLAHALGEAMREHSAIPRTNADRTIVVGDIHSCGAALDELITKHDRPRTQWVFAGDLFDRGPDPVRVWNAVRALGDRALVVTGNHERNLRHVLNGTRRYREADLTAKALIAEGVTTDELRDLVNLSVPAALVGDWLVTHGGVGNDAATLLRDGHSAYSVAECECITGIGERGVTYRGRGDYDTANARIAGKQLHGHRGHQTTQPLEQSDDSIICLEAGAGDGGLIRAAIIEAGELAEIVEVSDGVKVEPVQPQLDLLAQMEASDLVRVRPVEGFAGIVSCNFTREAFQSGGWDRLTTKARGLFIDTTTRKVVARGYEKFFHIDEQPGRTMQEWERAAACPVIARRKANGFLALVASVHGELLVATKSGITPYSEVARRLLLEQLGYDGAEQLRLMLERTHCTAAFEAISTADPHPVDDAADIGDHLVLLDCISNAEQFETVDGIRDGIAARFGFNVAEVVDTATDPSEFQALVARARQRGDEGVVLIDASGYRGKVKADRYAQRKAIRGRIERVWRGKADTLGQRHEGVEKTLRATGVWDRLTDFEVVGLDGSAKLDLSRLCEAAGI